jgi:hypothetical protein
VAISTRVNKLANDDLHDTAYSGETTEVTWQAHGALQILRAAYAATYRQMLAINHQLEACARGAGTPDTIFEHPEERAAHLELIQHEGGMRQGAGVTTSEEARDDQGWPFSSDPINLYQGKIAPL